MKVYEIINFNGALLRMFDETGIKLSDHRYIELYNEYARMLEAGEKVSYIVAHLSEKYSISERSVYSLIKRLGSDCK